MTGPDEGGLAGRGHLRAAQADREQAITVLKAAYAQGRLTKDELEARVGQAFASRTYAELAALTADIPADSLTASPAAAGSAAGGPPPSRPARTMARAARRSGICLLVAVALVEAALLADNFLLIVAASFALIAASGFFGYGILDAWQERRSRGQLPAEVGSGPPGTRGPPTRRVTRLAPGSARTAPTGPAPTGPAPTHAPGDRGGIDVTAPGEVSRFRSGRCRTLPAAPVGAP